MASSEPARADLAAIIDHTLLAPQATREEVEAHVAEAAELGVAAICVSPAMLPVHAPGLVVATVAGFPSGKHHSLVKAMEARLAVDQGASEVDVVVDVGAAVAGRFEEILGELVAVRDAIPNPIVLKVIIESAAQHDILGLEAGDESIVKCCEAALNAGADFVKTSTGFHPAGGASLRAVQLMSETARGQMGVKASGGIRDTETALAMVDAGATRLGLSGSRAVLAGLS